MTNMSCWSVYEDSTEGVVDDIFRKTNLSLAEKISKSAIFALMQLG